MRLQLSPHRKSAPVKTCVLRARFAPEQLEPRLHFAAQVAISEFMAKNNAAIKDDTGLYSDWIELHNAGDAVADLSGWRLTDDATSLDKWAFPAGVSLQPGAYMIVWASGLDHSTAGQPLHTNFKMNDAGEYLALVQPNGSVQQEFAPAYPNQDGDISYGLSDENNLSSPLVYFYKPTPGAVNQPNSGPVSFSKPGGGYTASFSVTLSSATPGATIRYTTNGAAPTAASPVYTGPVAVGRDMIIRAQAFAAGLLSSPVTSEQYFMLDSSVSTFHSNLPLVVIDTGGQGVGEETQTPVTAMVIDSPSGGGETTLTQTPQFIGRAGLNIRGQSSAGFPKHQYHFELWDESDSDDGHSLLGMPKEADWVLYAPYSEKSLMQNQLAYQWAREMGEYAVRTRWVEVFVNGSGPDSLNYANDYQGVYLLMEKIEAGPDRVNIQPLLPGQDTMPDVSGGYLWHKDKTDPEDSSSFSTPRQSFLFEDPTAAELDAAQKAWLKSYMTEFENTLYGASFADPVNGYAKYINVQSFIDNWIDVEMTKNIDGFRLSTYYYKDRNGKITMGPVWDYNLSLGNADYLDGARPIGWYHDGLGASEYTYFDRLTQDPAFMRALASRWKDLRSTVFSTKTLMSDVDANFATLTNNNGVYPIGANPAQPSTNPVVRNFKKWQILGSYVWPNGYVGNSWMDEVSHLRDFISTRVLWMDSQLYPYLKTTFPGVPTALTATAVSGAAVQLSWTPADANASSWIIDRSENNGASWTTLPAIAGGLSTYTMTGLKSATAYVFRIHASNRIGTTASSNSASVTTKAESPAVNVTSFNSATGLTRVGGARVVTDSSTNLGTVQLALPDLNKVGAMWTTAQQDVRKFSTTFTFQLKSPSAEGMTFTIQRAGLTAVGTAGDGLGYSGIADSLAVKFDMGPGGSTTGLYTGGSTPVGGLTETTPGTVDFSSGDMMTCTLSYDGKDLTQTIIDIASGAAYVRTYTDIDLPTILGGNTAYVGFTAATGALKTVDARVHNWVFTAAPLDPPVLKSFVIGDGSSQRSNVKQISLSFNRAVILSAGAISLSMLNSGGSGANDGSAPTDVSSVIGTPTSPDNGVTWVFTFLSNSAYTQQSSGASTGSLIDGIYTATFNPGNVTAVGGGTITTGASVTFHRLFGDSDGNGSVNTADYGRFRNTFGLGQGDAGYDDAFDFDGGQVVSTLDYGQFRVRFGKVFSYGP